MNIIDFTVELLKTLKPLWPLGIVAVMGIMLLLNDIIKAIRHKHTKYRNGGNQ